MIYAIIATNSRRVEFAGYISDSPESWYGRRLHATELHAC
eukprot:COSAG02_NODE_66704_length_254_cov_1.767742_1_plen_39_part_01